jgi:hypothetical protein
VVHGLEVIDGEIKRDLVQISGSRGSGSGFRLLHVRLWVSNETWFKVLVFEFGVPCSESRDSDFEKDLRPLVLGVQRVNHLFGSFRLSIFVSQGFNETSGPSRSRSGFRLRDAC